MKYRPNWLKIIFVSIIFHVVILSALFFIFPKKESEENLIQEIEWVDVNVAENFSSAVEAENISEKIPETFDFPAVEIPATVEATENFSPTEIPSTSAEPIKTPEKKSESKNSMPPAEKNISTEKNFDEDLNAKLKVFVKVFPKDIVNQLIENGTLKEKPILSDGKIILEVTVNKGGIVEKVQIIQGGTNEINILSEAAASGWIFVPFLDEDGKPKEMKTKIEFKAEDF